MRLPALIVCHLLTTLPAAAQVQSACIALAQGQARVVPVAFGAPLEERTVRIRYLDHASFAIETPAGHVAVTDYTGYIGNPDVVPDVVTMNNAHSSHYTDQPDPRIPHVLRGWGVAGSPARIEVDLGDLFVRNVTSDLRGPFGDGARADGNSMFIFEAAGLCIAHLGHLHQPLSVAQRAAIGRVDVVMVPVDGSNTMPVDSMVGVIRDLRARVIFPMHWFNANRLAAFLAAVSADFDVVELGSPEVELSLVRLPRDPIVMVLDPAFIP